MANYKHLLLLSLVVTVTFISVWYKDLNNTLKNSLGTFMRRYEIHKKTQRLADIIGQYGIHFIKQRTNRSSHRSDRNMNVESTCSGRATARGRHQKVVSFCYYGLQNHSREYFKVSALDYKVLLYLFFHESNKYTVRSKSSWTDILLLSYQRYF